MPSLLPRIHPALAPVWVLCSLASLALLTTSPAVSDTPEAIPSAVESLIPMNKEDSYQSLIQATLADFEAKKYSAALEKIQSATELYPQDPFVLNLKGAIYTKLKDWEEARRFFNRALNEDPNFFPARFNLGEVLFLEGNSEEALKYFETLNDTYRGNDLIQFKLVLLFLLTERTSDAERMAERIQYPGNSPAWYYAQAALAFAQGNRREGRRVLNAAKELFSAEQIALYEESLDESGLVK
jgi:Flp pilus assembly protein TadD